MGVVLPIVSAVLLAIAAITGTIFFFRNRRIRQQSTVQYDASLPQPSHYLLIAIYLTVIAIFSSFVPLQYREKSEANQNDYFKPRDRRPAQSLLDPDHEIKHSWTVVIMGQPKYVPANTSDFLGNILFVLPIAYFWMGVFLLDSENRIGKIAAIVIGVLAFTALRIVIEYIQYWAWPRVVSQGDVIAQSIGIAFGATAWLVAGQRFTDWIRSKTIDLRPLGFLVWVLIAYLLGFLIFTILPLDITIRGADLARKFRDGLIWFVPFSEPEWQPKLLFTLLTYVPIGMLLATGFHSGQERLRNLGTCVVLGGLMALVIEFSQIFVVDRLATSSDFFSGIGGIIVGWVIMYIFFGSPGSSQIREDRLPFMSRIGPYLAASGIYSTVLFIIFCSPFAPIQDVELTHVRYLAFYQLVVDAGRFETEFEAIMHMVRLALMFAPLGALLAMTAVGPTIPTPIRAILLSIAVVFSMAIAFTIEMLQVYLPPHVSDIMDVLWCTVGAALGVGITAYLAIFRSRHESMVEESSFA